jgi:hypothetical protein
MSIYSKRNTRLVQHPSMSFGLAPVDTASPGELDKTRQIKQDVEFYAEQRKLKESAEQLDQKISGNLQWVVWD